MEFTDLFRILADYLDFAVDLLSARGMEKYARLDKISPELVSFFVAGVLFAYVIASAKKLPGYEDEITTGVLPSESPPQTATADTAPREKEQTPEVARFVLLSIVGTMAFHGFLVLYDRVLYGGSIGTLKDSYNAAFAVWAVYNPVNAIFKQTVRITKPLAAVSRGWAMFVLVIHLAVSLTYLGMLYYWVYALAQVHRTTQMYMLGPMIILGFVGLLIGVLVWRADRVASASPAAT